jgi:hypothetical protein
MRGDNISIVLASYFEPGIESDELDDSGTWKQGAIDAADEILNAIHAHYATALERVTRERDEARAERDALANTLDAGSDPALISRIIMNSIENKVNAESAEAKLRDYESCIQRVIAERQKAIIDRNKEHAARLSAEAKLAEARKVIEALRAASEAFLALAEDGSRLHKAHSTSSRFLEETK